MARATRGGGRHFGETAVRQQAVGFEPALRRTDAAASRHGAGGHHAARHVDPAPSGTYDRPANASPRRRRGGVLSTVLIVVGVVLLAVAGGMFGWAQWQYFQQDKVNEQLATFATVSDDPAAPAPQGPQVDWAGLKAVNDDAVGWVQIPGTVVNFPVYQGETNETYLRTSATGEYSIGGQIFMDYEGTRPGMVDPQTIIYGHHLNNGQMFALVDEMADQAKFDSVGTVWYVTEQATYELEPLFFFRTPATNGAARQMSFSSMDEFHAYLAGELGQAAAKSPSADAAVRSVTKVLTLATCDYDNDFGQGNGRGLVVCALKSEVAAAQAGEQSASSAPATSGGAATADAGIEAPAGSSNN